MTGSHLTADTIAAPPPRPVDLTSLAPFFTPRSIAVVGASERAGSVGRALLANLHAFRGRVFPINPHRDFILDRRSYPNFTALPVRPDLALIAVPAASVPAVVRACADSRVPAAIIISAGFRECGREGAALERAAVAEARRGKVRLIGPNCLGLMRPDIGLNASFSIAPPCPGHIAFLSQSGALCSAILDWSRREQVGFSTFVSVGSMADVGWGDLIEWLGDDPLTHSILLYMEAMNQAPGFLAAARRVSKLKPILVLKTGRTVEAARAVCSHTGSMAGRDEVFDAAFRRVGVKRVNTVAELFGLAELLPLQSSPCGSRLGIVTNAGGPGALAADALVLAGGQLAQLNPVTLAGLNSILPAHWSHDNPADVLGDASPERFSRAVQLMVDEPSADGVLAILTPQSMTDPAGTAERLAAIAAGAPKPILAAWMGGDAVAAGRDVLHRRGVPVFEYPDLAAVAFRQMSQIDEVRREAQIEVHPPDQLRAPARITGRLRTLLQDAREAGEKLLTVHESMQVLSSFGIPCIQTVPAASADEAVMAAGRIGYPVALKLLSKTIVHKSDIGGVQLNLRDESQVRAAWHQIYRQVRAQVGQQHWGGVAVQPMTAGDGREFIIGSSTDPIFGPVLLFGAGGRFAEIQRDYAVEIPPLDLRIARMMAERTRVFQTLVRSRGLPSINLAQLDELLVRFAELVTHGEGIAEIDLNPVVVTSERLCVIDARIMLQPSVGISISLPNIP